MFWSVTDCYQLELFRPARTDLLLLCLCFNMGLFLV